MLTSDATRKIGKQLGLNSASIVDAKTQQGAFTAEVEGTGEAVKKP
ncbi:MAG: hypothetical protein M9949_10750 [Candidatus Kapabacteria bacterium]|nr:hypothetical protein [Candidatus Kapabacteria bacterium]